MKLSESLCLHCVNKGCFLADLSLDEYKASSPLFANDIYEALDPYTAVERRNSAGGTGFKQVNIAL